MKFLVLSTLLGCLPPLPTWFPILMELLSPLTHPPSLMLRLNTLLLRDTLMEVPMLTDQFMDILTTLLLMAMDTLMVLLPTLLLDTLPWSLTPNGAVTPADTPDVAAAKAAHVAAGGAGHYAAGYPHAHGPAHHGAAHHGLAHHGPAHHGAAHHGFAHHGTAHHGFAHAGHQAGYGPGYNGLVAHPNGAVVPVESPEIQAAPCSSLRCPCQSLLISLSLLFNISRKNHLVLFLCIALNCLRVLFR
ncbi:KRAB [Lepeophtheirus salmonis]|uniref:KRAB n=1 Tax=Lepeophtheirus salmonis TaxID=72036 RepID=A0A7R8CUH4_LEPSM|nr:KRAB [Lepeophtheirus salmonis]CAF2936500.1 KRAB [Lepeophtheirus salmonis]